MSSSQVVPALAAHPNLAAVLVEPHADTRRSTTRTHHGHRRRRHRHVLVDDPALHRRTLGLGMAFGHVHATHDDLVLGREHPHDVALFAPLLAREHLDSVTLANPHHSTSGA